LDITGIISVLWKHFSTKWMDWCKGFGDEEC